MAKSFKPLFGSRAMRPGETESPNPAAGRQNKGGGLGGGGLGKLGGLPAAKPPKAPPMSMPPKRGKRGV